MCFGQRKLLQQSQQQAAATQAQLEQQEAQRQADITAGRGKIDAAFAGFNNDYYKNYTNDYTNYYYPQIDQQYGRAVGKTRASLVDQGIDQSTVAASKFGDLFQNREQARTQAADSAAGAANALQGNVEKTKTDLYNLNESAADPAAANSRAQAEATSLVAPPTTSPLGDIFSSIVSPVVYAAQAYRNRAPAPYTSPISNPSGNGSGQVVR